MISGTLCINRQNDGLRAEFPRQFGNELGPFHCRRVYGDFVCPSAHHGASVLKRANAASSGKRNGQFRGDTPDGSEKSRAVVARRGNVQHHQFVGAFGVITRRQSAGIAGIAQSNEVDALDDAFAVGVEARNDAMRQAHAAILRKFRNRRAPASPLFSG